MMENEKPSKISICREHPGNMLASPWKIKGQKSSEINSWILNETPDMIMGASP
ncbi:MAG: hypothetical protein RE469_04060 [Cuniculiplasma divulgatum]|nr:MAG: hypothetical protein RE469_04060 [Cuniculiplasma divulgatum]